MKATYKLLLLSSGLLTLSAPVKAQSVYQAPYRSDGEVRVYVSRYKGEADLLVYKTQYRGEATGNTGVWYFTEYRGIADKRIFITDTRGDADIVICYTPYRGEAGWRNQQKKQLMEKKK